MNIIEDILSACVSSSKSERMVLVQSGSDFKLHTQLNVMMTMPSGSFKSTILKNIPDKVSIKAQDYTHPAMIGSIGKNGLVKGYLMKAAGKCVIVDEFHSLDYKSRKALLSITEDQRADRVFGFKCDNKEKKKGKFLKYNICGNELHIDYIRCSILLSGIFAPHKKSKAGVDDFAFSSRFMPINLNTSLDEIDDIGLGKKNIFRIRYEPYKEAPVFEDWEKFLRIYRQFVNNMPKKIKSFFNGNSEFYARGRLHFARLFSWNSRNNSTVSDWEKYLPFIPFFLTSCVTSSLTHSEFEIHNMICQGMKQNEISDVLDVSESYISKITKKIKGLGLG